jgi:hypothetical protein
MRARTVVGFAVVSLLMVGLVAMWSVVAQRQLAMSLASESRQHLESAHKAFTYTRTRIQAELQGHCRVMVEDPRLKATLATEGMDAATVADILQDLTKLRGAGFLMVLAPDGRVFAEAGAPELRGLDLAESSVVKRAQATPDAVVGSWVLGNRVMDLSIMSIRYGEDLVAFLVVGQAVDQTVMHAIADQTGVDAASALATKVVAASTTDTAKRRVLDVIAGMHGAFAERAVDVDGERYIASVIELGETAQTHRLVLARPVAVAREAFEPLRWMLFVPPLIVLVAVLFSMFGIRLFRRS